MNIRQLIKKDYPTVSINDDIASIEKNLTPGSYLVVLNEKLEAIGLISYCDIFNHPAGMVKDCNLSKPPVSPDCKISEVFKLMENACTDVLPVYIDQEFVGVISHHDLTRYMVRQHDRYKLIFQQVVHDLRNPIANIIGLNRLLEENLEKPENIELTTMTKDASIHALDILSGLLFIEKNENEQSGAEITDLNKFIREGLTDLKGILTIKNIQLVCELANEEFYYLIDRLQLKRTIHNLASNAIKFSYPNSKVHVSSMILGKIFTLKIQDQGIGIPLNKQPYIFDQFTPASRPGTSGELSTGLGLYFSKACIERLKGKIWFESIEGQGTTFFVEFKT